MQMSYGSITTRAGITLVESYIGLKTTIQLVLVGDCGGWGG